MRRLTWHNASQTDEQLREYLILALLRSNACVTLQDSRLQYLYIANLPAIWSVPSAGEPTEASLFGEDLGEKLFRHKLAVVESGMAEKLEVVTKGDHVFEFHVELSPSAAHGEQVMTTIVDLTETRRREKLLKDLLMEVSHRSKNLLAVVQSLATQTARDSHTLDEFQSDFRGRLYSLSKSQDLVTDTDWYGAKLLDLIKGQISVCDSRSRAHVHFTGQSLVLTPNAALHLGLGFHELISGDVREGEAGRDRQVLVSCRLEETERGRTVELVWEEHRQAPATPGSEAAQRFSDVLLQQVIPASLSGSARYSQEGGKTVYVLRFPASEQNVKGI